MSTLFDIPIYRCSRDKHDEESQHELQKRLDDIPFPREEVPESYQSAEAGYWNRDWYPWTYNDIIGWIHLTPFVTNIHGDLFLARKKRIMRRTKDKSFFMQPHVKFDVRIADDDSPRDIYKNIRDAVTTLMKSPKFKRRYVDLEAFDAIGPFIDWKAVIDQQISQQ